VRARVRRLRVVGVSAHGSGAGSVVVVLVSVVVPGSSARAGAASDERASASKSPRASDELLMQYPFVVYRTAVSLRETARARRRKGRSGVKPGFVFVEAA
jgi:hypothetical protein